MFWSTVSHVAVLALSICKNQYIWALMPLLYSFRNSSNTDWVPPHHHHHHVGKKFYWIIIIMLGGGIIIKKSNTYCAHCCINNWMFWSTVSHVAVLALSICKNQYIWALMPLLCPNTQVYCILSKPRIKRQGALAILVVLSQNLWM